LRQLFIIKEKKPRSRGESANDQSGKENDRRGPSEKVRKREG